jgi:hypothetical protein
MATVKYIYPNGSKAPTQAQMEKEFGAVHALVTFTDDAGTADITHNMQFESEAPAEALQIPIVSIHAIAGNAPVLPVVSQKDENTTTLTKAAAGGSHATYDVWISRHEKAQPWKAEEKPKPQK